jgi:uncharacterized damage-inducible protein DinB
MSTAPATAVTIMPEQLLEHWLGHRRLTRRVIEAFPDDQLFTYSIGGMRTFAQLAREILAMGAPLLRGLVTGEWGRFEEPDITSKAELLRRWDESTTEIGHLWPRLPAGRLQETVTAFGMYTAPGYHQILYAIDNEVHHRGQGYVYLRALGIEPPPFWER